MWFNTLDFAVFFIVVWTLYWLLPLRAQNVMLLVASYFFYGYWDWRFLSLIAISTMVDYIAGLKIGRAATEGGPGSARRKKAWLIASICTNLGLLGFFKYFDFFVDSLSAVAASFGLDPGRLHLGIVLPVGISFYTFQTMSYTLDIYRGKMKPTRRLVEFALFVAFFPQLVAGPIERAKALLPQMLRKRRFDFYQFVDGLHLIFWGLFKKIFVADNLAPFVDRVFGGSLEQYAAIDPSGFAVILGAYAFALQIYCDFSGYSDIARGCAKCMGFELRLNFNHPFASKNPSEFWQRWHISLSTWVRDYLYISMGGSRRGTVRTYLNLGVAMVLVGLWHGAQWGRVLWGAHQAVLLILHRMLEPLLAKLSWARGRLLDGLWRLAKMIFMFQLFCMGLIIFRALSVGQALDMFWRICVWKGAADWSLTLPLLGYAGPLLIFEVIQVILERDDLHRLERVPAWAKSAACAMVFYLLAFYGATAQSFFYFQF